VRVDAAELNEDWLRAEEKNTAEQKNHTPQCTCYKTKNSIKSYREKEGHGMATLHTK